MVGDPRPVEDIVLGDAAPQGALSTRISGMKADKCRIADDFDDPLAKDF